MKTKGVMMVKFVRIMLVLAGLMGAKSAIAGAFRSTNIYATEAEMRANARYLYNGEYYYGETARLYNKSEVADDEGGRQKHLSLAGRFGYMYPVSSKLADGDGCRGATWSGICNGNIPSGIEMDFSDRSFMSFGLGVNSETFFRIEAEYFRAMDDIKIRGMAEGVPGGVLDYNSKFSVQGGTLNLYIDLIVDRRRPYSVFIPYAMAGIGRSELDIEDINFIHSGYNMTIGGSLARNTTFVFGGGFSIGLNNYISFDVGYRYYNFGKVKPSPRMVENDGVYTTNYDMNFEFELSAHTAVAGVRLQI